MKNKVLLGFALLGALALVAGCANKQGETEAPVFITIDLPLQPLVIDVNNPVPLQIQTINLASHFKNPTATDPQHFADVEISYYTVTFLRLDGGTLLPKTETFAANVLVPSGGSAKLSNFPIMSASAVQSSPFDQLLPFNGGIDRETGLTEIHMFYKLTFFGQTVSGHRVQSETGTGDFFVH